MIGKLKVRNFKSLRRVTIGCRRINVLVGEPNTGKSNLLESLGILSFTQNGGCLKSYVRMENMSNLFYANNVDDDILIEVDNTSLRIHFEERRFIITCQKGGNTVFSSQFNLQGENGTGGWRGKHDPAFRFYRFTHLEMFSNPDPGFLNPPSGDNLLAVLLAHKKLRSLIGGLFRPYGFRLTLNRFEGRIEILQMEGEEGEVLVTYPYSMVSDTLQRLVFYLIAIGSNSGAILVLEEPEAHAFPEYTKLLAERIATDRSNQYFISTHNPYLFHSLLEKTPETELGVFITSVKGYETQVKQLGHKELQEILDEDVDIFFNLSWFIDEETST